MVDVLKAYHSLDAVLEAEMGYDEFQMESE